MRGNPQRQQPGRSFFGACLNQCGERPWRAFAVAWLALFVLSIGVAFINFDHVASPMVAPAPEGIPYARFSRQSMPNHGIDVDLDRLPEYEVSHPDAGRNYHIATGADGKPRLRTTYYEYIGSSGWPDMSYQWLVSSAWDVTEPFNPKRVPAADPDLVPPFFAYEKGFQFAQTALGGEGIRAFKLNFPGALVQIAWPQLIAACFVFALGSTYWLRRGKRRKRDQCLECGQQRDPNRPSAACPECAQLPNDERGGWGWFLLGTRSKRWRVMLMVLAFLLLAAAQVGSSERSENPTTLQYFFRQWMIRNNPWISDWYRDHNMFYGWPVRLVTTQEDHYYSYAPGQDTPVRTACGFSSSVQFDRGLCNVLWVHPDASVVTTVNINWPWIVLLLSMLVVLAALLAAVQVVLLLIFRRRGAQPS